MDFKKISVRTFYLKKEKPFDYPPIIFPESYRLIPQKSISVKNYLDAYKRVGEKYGWAGRLLMSVQDLQNILDSPKNRLWFLYHGNEFVGLSEMLINEAEAELLYLGILDKYQSRGLGKALMHHAFYTADSLKLKSLLLHTCEFDGEAALPFYYGMGFQLSGEQLDEEYYPVSFLGKKGLL